MDDTITPKKVLAMVASAIPADLRADIIIVGSLAACYPTDLKPEAMPTCAALAQ